MTIGRDIYATLKALRNGYLIVYPTDTLYGLGADVFNEDAVKKVYNVKKRDYSNPLPVAVSSLDMMEDVAFVDQKAKRLVDFFMPGELTLVLKKKECIPDLVNSGLDCVAVRIPDDDIALEIVSRFGPLTATSANIHGESTEHYVESIKEKLGSEEIKYFLDDGIRKASPSTVVDITFKKPRVLRKGDISKDDILDVINNDG
ncbi:MAG: L-threonylcarbamoyladenylate synthase [Candidatus Thermoplasmatota archaeon]